MLLNLKHTDGTSVCKLYGVTNSKVSHRYQGPIVSFNLKRPDGSWYGYNEVEKLASLSGIHVRTGCFCNPGACAKYLGLSHVDLISNIEAGHVCWDDRDILDGKPTGAVRVSFGYMSNFEDARKFMDFIVSSFASHSDQVYPLRPRSIPIPVEVAGLESEKSRYHLKSIIVYPIKSCGGFRVQRWPVCSTGLLHDREWLLESSSGEILTQKKIQEMCFITTLIDLELGILIVESPSCKEKLKIKLEADSGTNDTRGGYDDDSWFTNALGRPCKLVRNYGTTSACTYQRSTKSSSSTMGVCRDVEFGRMNFVNEGQFLLISDQSVSDLNNRLSMHGDLQQQQQIIVNEMRFRPNLVISGGKAYEEDGWTSLTIGGIRFISLGGCNRCQMINLNPREAELKRSTEPLATLAAYRRTKGKIYFGILLKCDINEQMEGKSDGSLLKVGQQVYPYSD